MFYKRFTGQDFLQVVSYFEAKETITREIDIRPSYLALKIDMVAILFPKQGHNYCQASFPIHLHFVQI